MNDHRTAPRRVEVYNEGLAVFLYDAHNESVIRGRNPDVVWGIGANTLDEDVTRSLFEQGVLAGYGLPQDDTVRADVTVGSPPDADELPARLRRLSGRALLHLPSGRLCVHSYNSLPMGDNGETPDELGAEVRVAPGSYVVTVFVEHPFDRDEDPTWTPDSPNALVFLTPEASAFALGAPSRFMLSECVR